MKVLNKLNSPVPMWLFALWLAGSMSVAALAAIPIFTGSVAVPAAGSETENQLSASSLVATNGSKVLTSTTSGLSPTFTGLTLSGLSGSAFVCTTVGSVLTVTCPVVGVANGGTGVASYTVGDLLYASGTLTLSRLADVATGSVLASGGVGVAPSWSTAPAFTGTNITGVPNGALTNSSITVSGTTNRITTSGCGPVSLGATCTLNAPQDLNTTASFQVGSLGVGTAANGTAGEIVANKAIISVGALAENQTSAAFIDEVSSGVARFGSYGPNTTTIGKFEIQGITSNASTVTTLFDYGVTTASTFTLNGNTNVLGSVQATSDGSHTSYAVIAYKNDGSAVASTYHTVIISIDFGTITQTGCGGIASGTYYCVTTTLGGAAAFASGGTLGNNGTAPSFSCGGGFYDNGSTYWTTGNTSGVVVSMQPGSPNTIYLGVLSAGVPSTHSKGTVTCSGA